MIQISVSMITLDALKRQVVREYLSAQGKRPIFQHGNQALLGVGPISFIQINGSMQSYGVLSSWGRKYQGCGFRSIDFWEE